MNEIKLLNGQKLYSDNDGYIYMKFTEVIDIL